MPTLDASTEAVLEMIRISGVPPMDTLSPAEARLAYRNGRGALAPDPSPLATVRDLNAAGQLGPIGLRLYRDVPEGAATGVLVYYHGGGNVVGDLDTHDAVCRRIALQSRATVIAVDYRMGPEHRFPAATNDAIAALRWIAAHAGELGIDPGRIAVGGDSAGGTLSAAVTLDSRDNGGPPIALQVLVYPSTDMSTLHPSRELFAQGYGLTKTLIDYFRTNYFLPDFDRTDWRASPLLAASHEGLPRALIVTAGFDPLRDEGEAYAQRLIEAGVPVTVRRFTGQIHGFITMGRVVPEALVLIDDIAAAMISSGL